MTRPREAALAAVADRRRRSRRRVERRLAAVELEVAVGRERRERLVEHGRRVGLVPAVGRAVDRAPRAGAIAEVPLVEVQLAQLGVVRRVVLDRLVEDDGADVRIAVRCRSGPSRRRCRPPRSRRCVSSASAGVIGDEAQHAAPVVLVESPWVPAKSSAYILKMRETWMRRARVVDAAVPLAREEAARVARAQRLADALRRVGRGAHRRAAVRAAVDREVDARLAEAGRAGSRARRRRGSPRGRRRCAGAAGRTGRRASSTPS